MLGPSGVLGTDPPLVEVCRLQLVIAEAIQNSSASVDRAEDALWSRRARALLEVGAHRHSTMQEIASLLGMSTHGFRRKFSALTGLSPTQYRTARTIDRACELMQGTSMLDKEIAMDSASATSFTSPAASRKSPASLHESFANLSRGRHRPPGTRGIDRGWIYWGELRSQPANQRSSRRRAG